MMARKSNASVTNGAELWGKRVWQEALCAMSMHCVSIKGKQQSWNTQ